MTLLLFLIDAALLFAAFRLLSSPRHRLPTLWRFAAGALLLFIASAVSLWVACREETGLALALAAATSSLGIHGRGLADFTIALGRWRLLVFLLSASTIIALTFFAIPVATFLSSPEELQIGTDFLLETNARKAVLFLYAALIAYALAFTPRMRTLLTMAALWLLVVVLVYAYILPLGYPIMSGLAFEQLPTATDVLILRSAADLVLVSLLAAAVSLVVLKVDPRRLTLCIGLLGLSIFATAGAGLFRASSVDVGPVGSDEVEAIQPLAYSPNHPNALVLFLDRFMGSYVETILERDPELRDRLSGFVWYPRTVSAGQNSIAGVHPMFGGYDYTPDAMNARGRPLKDLSVEAFSILPYNFSKKGYQVNVVNPRGLGFTVMGDCSRMQIANVRCSHLPTSVLAQEAKAMDFPLGEIAKSGYTDLLVLLASMRAAPYSIKEVIYQKGPWRQFLDHSAGTTFKEWAALKALPRLSAVSEKLPTLNILSNILPHEPYYLGEDCRPHQHRLELPLEQVRQRGETSLFGLQHAIAARCALLLVADYIDFLKRSDVYDNTKIVVVSDHGIVGNVEDKSSRAVAGGTTSNDYVRTRSVLLVKPIGATGPLRVSEDFMPNAEVPRIVCEDVGGCVNPYLADKPIDTAGRDDPFRVFVVPWQFRAQNTDSFVIRRELELRGKDPYAASGWHVVK